MSELECLECSRVHPGTDCEHNPIPVQTAIVLTRPGERALSRIRGIPRTLAARAVWFGRLWRMRDGGKLNIFAAWYCFNVTLIGVLFTSAPAARIIWYLSWCAINLAAGNHLADRREAILAARQCLDKEHQQRMEELARRRRCPGTGNPCNLCGLTDP